jgi:NTP pyrophosphatase (non-canonical NTP hydrolase)
MERYPIEWLEAYNNMGEKFGNDQIIKLLEEMGELTQVICKYLNNGCNPKYLDHMAEEMGDVYHMLNGVMVLLKLQVQIRYWMTDKMEKKILPKTK